MNLKDIQNAIDQMEMRHFRKVFDSQKQFIHDGAFAFGKWSQWRRAATQEEADRILNEYRASKGIKT